MMFAALIGQDRPPKDTDTSTDVSQADRQQISDDVKRWNEGLLHTKEKVSIRVRASRSRNSTVKSHNINLGTSNEGGPCVDSGRSFNNGERHCCTIDGETCQRLRTRLHLVQTEY